MKGLEVAGLSPTRQDEHIEGEEWGGVGFPFLEERALPVLSRCEPAAPSLIVLLSLEEPSRQVSSGSFP